jgi:predicted Zn-dependent peptidase
MLSSQIAFSLREQKGWAYRLGSNIDLWKDNYYFYTTMGTGPETMEPAIQGILEEINQFKARSLEQTDVIRTQNSILGALVRRRASRESQAYTLALNTFMGYPVDHLFSIYDQIKSVDVPQISDLRKKYLQTEYYNLFYTIPSPSANDNKMPGMPNMMPH